MFGASAEKVGHRLMGQISLFNEAEQGKNCFNTGA